MLRVAICDDDQSMVEILSQRFNNFFKNTTIEYDIQRYTNGNDLLEYNNTKPFDIIFLDIDMPKINGIEVAQDIRNINSNMIIIFVTNKENLVFQSIKYAPFRFVRKSNLDDDIQELFVALEEKINFDSMEYKVYVCGRIKYLQISKIAYFESFRHDIIAHYYDGTTYDIKETLSSLAKRLEKYGFIRVHKSYLVNYRNIFVINTTDLKLDNSQIIPISRLKRQEIQSKYQVFLRR